MPQLHMPLQSGSDRILKAMRRSLPLREVPRHPRPRARADPERRDHAPTSSSASPARPRRTSRRPCASSSRRASPRRSPSSTRSAPARRRRPWPTRCRRRSCRSATSASSRCRTASRARRTRSWSARPCRGARRRRGTNATARPTACRAAPRTPGSCTSRCQPRGCGSVIRAPATSSTVAITEAAPFHLIADSPTARRCACAAPARATPGIAPRPSPAPCRAAEPRSAARVAPDRPSRRRLASDLADPTTRSTLRLRQPVTLARRHRRRDRHRQVRAVARRRRATVASGRVAEIVNADAMQLYRGMDIGTAKLPVGERRGIPHHLLDVLDPRDEASVADYQRGCARARSTTSSARGAVPILVGGSGLYVSSVHLRLPVSRHRSRRCARGSRPSSREVGPGLLHRRLLGRRSGGRGVHRPEQRPADRARPRGRSSSRASRSVAGCPERARCRGARHDHRRCRRPRDELVDAARRARRGDVAGRPRSTRSRALRPAGLGRDGARAPSATRRRSRSSTASSTESEAIEQTRRSPDGTRGGR